MRLGACPCRFAPESRSAALYGSDTAAERHRHRYEFNPEFRSELEAAGLVIAGTSPDGRLVEVVELEGHPWFIGVQYHPEYKSTALHPHPLFVSFVKAAEAYCEQNNVNNK